MICARLTIPAFGLLLLCAGPGPGHAENVDPDVSGARYAYGENIGWLDAEPLGDGGPGVEVADFELTGWIWAENAGWVSLSCKNTASCAAQPFGVANDGQGLLSGHAWSENLGWIDFAPSTAGVTIDPATGVFAGKAWSENAGWISFDVAAHALKTGWTCSPAPPVPADPIELALDRSGTTALLAWPAVPGASAYDVVRGGLGVLHASAGDFSAAADACLGSKQAATSASDADVPPSGGAFWYLARAVNCGGPGSYDAAGAGQVGLRDAEIDAAAAACP